MNNDEARQPYPGLRPFTRAEADLFFGRKSAINEIVGRLAAARFVAVVGPSGSGKTSLVRAGLVEALEAGLMHRAGARWKIAELHPGRRPFRRLAESLACSAADDVPEPGEEDISALRRFLKQGPRALVEWCKAGNLPPRTNLLVVVDRFEELLSGGSEDEEAGAFVAALRASAAVPLEEARIYVVVTMRSEYLGAAPLIDSLTETIDKGHYLIPRMGRNQLRRAITGPAAACGLEIEPALTDRLLEDLEAFPSWDDSSAAGGHQLGRLARRADQLPLMQHALSLLWSMANARGGAKPLLTQADYDVLGGLRGALDAHGRDILEEILPEHRGVAALVFGALTAGSSPGEALRRPTAFGELVEIAHGEEMAVRELVEAFRAPGRNFLTPPRPESLQPDTRINVVHESLIRQWDAFVEWQRQEIASAAAWRRLSAAADRWSRREGGLLSGPALASLGGWWDAEQPAPTWAARYGGDYELVEDFLEASRRADDAEAVAEDARQRMRTRNRILAFAAVVAVCIVTPLAVFAGYTAIRANEQTELARRAALAVEEAGRVAEAERQRAEAARLAGEEERQRAAVEAERAEEERARADAERDRAEAERERALAAELLAEEAARLTERARRQTEEERNRALAAIERATAAGAARDRAEAERREAVMARNEALLAAKQAEFTAEEADELRRVAETARKEAVEDARAADTARRAAVERAEAAILAEAKAMERAEGAEAARQHAVAEADAANAARVEAVAQMQAAIEVREEAIARAEAEVVARDAADAESERAIAARAAAEADSRRAEELADQERLRALAAVDQARAAEAALALASDELAKARAALAAAEAERDQAELARRRAVAAQSSSLDDASEGAQPLTE